MNDATELAEASDIPIDAPSLTPYLTSRCRHLGAKIHTGIGNRRMLSAATAAEQRLIGRSEVPACFGKRFAAPHDPVCRACDAQVLCLHRAANKTLIEAQEETGVYDIVSLAERMDIEPRSVRFMQQAAVALGTIPKAQLNSATPPETPAHLVDKSWPKRFLKERARNPILDRLPIGAVLRRPYDKKLHMVTICDGFYEYEGERYPTLYSVVLKIAGAKIYPRSHSAYRDRPRAISNFNMRRFFWKSIEEALPEI